MKVIKLVFKDATGILAEEFRTSYLPILEGVEASWTETYLEGARASGLFDSVEVVESHENFPFFMRRVLDSNFRRLWGRWTGEEAAGTPEDAPKPKKR